MSMVALLPALLTIIVAITTRRVAIALLTGVVGGALATANFQPLAGAGAVLKYLWASGADLDRLGIALFVCLVGGLLDMLALSGSYVALGESMTRLLNNPRKARLGNWLVSLLLFFDDYANALISGATMRPITDRHAQRPAMLAYLVDVLATFASVVFLSTWACFEGSLMQEAGAAVGVHLTATEFLIRSLPYHLYTYLSIFLTLLVAVTGRWFGARFDNQPPPPLHRLEIRGQGAHAGHAFIPLLVLLVTALASIFLVGFWLLRKDGSAPITLINILGRAPTIHLLVAATIISLIVAATELKRSQVLNWRDMAHGFFHGFGRMLPVAAIILLANGLAKVSDDLHTGQFITALLSGAMPPSLLAVFIFLLSALITVATGFSWSSMAIVMPVAFQLVTASGHPDFLPMISGAVICGAISGSQIVPFSDTSVIAATAYGLTPLYHVKTQLLQILAVILVTAGAFTLLGLGLPLWCCYGAAMIVIWGLHQFIAHV